MPRILTVLTLFLTGLLGQAVSAQQVTFDATTGVKIELPANQPNTLQVYVYDQYTNLIINGKFEHIPLGVDDSTSKKIRVYGGDLKDEVTLQGFSTVANPEIYLKGGNDLFVNKLNREVFVDGGPGNDEINCGNFGSSVRPGPGDDIVNGGAMKDWVMDYGDYNGDDQYVLRGGHDEVEDAWGNDTFELGSGNDRCVAVNGKKVIYAQDGHDDVICTGDVKVFLGEGDDYAKVIYPESVEIIGGDGDDEIIVLPTRHSFPYYGSTIIPLSGSRLIDIQGGPGNDVIRACFVSSLKQVETYFANLDGGDDHDVIIAKTGGAVFLNMTGKQGHDLMGLAHSGDEDEGDDAFGTKGSGDKNLGGSEVVEGGEGNDQMVYFPPMKDLGGVYGNSSWSGWKLPMKTIRPAPVFKGGPGQDQFAGCRWYAWSKYWIFNPAYTKFFKIMPYDGATLYDYDKTDYFQDYNPNLGDQQKFIAVETLAPAFLFPSLPLAELARGP